MQVSLDTDQNCRIQVRGSRFSAVAKQHIPIARWNQP
jgi:hypothetical protein